MKNTEQIIELLENCDSNEIMQVNNVYCQHNNYPDDEIYNNDEEFFDTFFQKSIDAVRAVSYGSYNYSHDYVSFNGNGNLDSYDYLDTNNLVDTVVRVATHIAENEELYSFLDLSDIDEEDDED